MPTEIVWQAPEFEYHAKGAAWFWASIILATAMLGFAVWQRNFLFAIFIIIAEILILIWSAREPQAILFRLDDHTLAIGPTTTYRLADLESFSIDTEEPIEWPTIALRFKNRFRPLVHIKVDKSRLPEVERALAKYAKEYPWEEGVIEALERFLGI